MKIIQKLLILTVVLFSTQNMFSQFVTSNIQNHLVDKRWSSEKNTDQKVLFLFKADGSFILFANGKEVAYEDYYISQTCNIDTSNFDDEKKGQVSSGNYIRTMFSCYVIELYADLKQFRIRSTSDSKWQDYYLLD